MSKPEITIDDLTWQAVLGRNRYATIWCDEPALQLFEQKFPSSVDNQVVFPYYGPAGTITVTSGQGKLHFKETAGGASTVTYVMEHRLKTGQFAIAADLAELSAGGLFSEFYVGVVITTSTATTDFTDIIYAKINRSEAAPNGVIELGYSKNGSFVGRTSTGPTIDVPLAFPCRLVLVMNQNSIALAVEENGVRRELHHYEIALADHDCILEATIRKFKPMIRFNCDAGIDATCTGVYGFPMGGVGHREHTIVRYENGEPWRSPEGLYAIAVDEVGVTALATGDAFYQSEYNRSQTAIWLYNADAARMVRPIGTIHQRENSRVFGLQEPRIVVDRHDGKVHVYGSNWNNVYDATYNPLGRKDSNDARLQVIQHYETTADPIDVLYGSKIIELDTVDLGDDIDFDDVSHYQTDIRRVGGHYYIVGTRAAPANKQIFVNRGTAQGSFTKHLWLDDCWRRARRGRLLLGRRRPISTRPAATARHPCACSTI
jgi:hypothetical protein